jgi:hypothetical protein
VGKLLLLYGDGISKDMANSDQKSHFENELFKRSRAVIRPAETCVWSYFFLLRSLTSLITSSATFFGHGK